MRPAEEDPGEPDPSVAMPPASVELVIGPLQPVLAPTDDEELGLEVLVRSLADEAGHASDDAAEGDDEQIGGIAGGTLRVWFDPARVEDRDELAAVLVSGGADAEYGFGSGARLLAELEVPATAPGEEQLIAVSVPIDSVPTFLESGVYAVTAEVLLDEDDAGPQDAATEDGGESTDGSDADFGSSDLDGADADALSSDAEQSADPADSADPTVPADSPDGSGEAVDDGTRVLTAKTALVLEGPEFPAQVSVTAVVPFVLPEQIKTMPTPEDLAAVAPRLEALLTAAESWRATLAVDPRLTTAIRAYGSTAPAPARELLARLEATPLPLFMLQFADADPAAQADLGFESLLQPIGLSHVTRLGDADADEGTDLADGTPADTDDSADAGNMGDAGIDAERGIDRTDRSDDPSQPTDPEQDEAEAEESTTGGDAAASNADDNAGNDATTDDPAADAVSDAVTEELRRLLDWPTAEPGAWPAEGAANAATLDLLRRSGITSLVLSSENVAEDTASRASIGGFDALISDARLGSHTRLALRGSSTAERLAGGSALAADLALAAETDSPGLVLAFDRGATADASAPAALLDELGALPWVVPTFAAEQPTGDGVLRGGGLSEQRDEMLRSAVQTSARIDELAPLLEHPEYLAEYQGMRLLETFATHYAAPGIDLAEVRSLIDGRDRELLEGVQVLTSESMQLVGTQSQVPVLLRNALPFDALVTLRAVPTSAAIQVPDRRFEDEQVVAGGNTTVLVPVNSRVSSGDSGLMVQVADAADDTVFASATLRLILRSSYESIMLVVLGSIAFLLLGIGVWRSVLRHRRPRAAAPDGGPLRARE